MIVFGWGRKSLDTLGTCGPAECPNCHNVTLFRHFRRKTWFTLFFIKVFPYEAREYLGCQVCGFGWEVTRGQSPESLLAGLPGQGQYSPAQAAQASATGINVWCPNSQCKSQVTVRKLFGRARCPRCGAEFNIEKAERA